MGMLACTASKVPEDIRTIYAFLGQILVELTDLMAEEVREWRAELRAAVKDWQDGSPEPDWQAFREWMNDAASRQSRLAYKRTRSVRGICHEDGMPALFPTEKEK
jgi:hypothetical protein